MRYWTLILISSFLAGNAFAEPATPAPVALDIVSADFGTFDASDPNETVFTPSLVVPHRQGQRYGWTIEVRTKLRSLSVSEEYLLPNRTEAKATASAAGDVLDIPQDRHNQISQRQLVPVEGRIYGEWAVGPSEPAGHRHLRVLVEGQIAADFEFDVK